MKLAGVDDDDFGVFGVRSEFSAVVVQDAHHDLGVDEVLRAAERDEADPGAGWRAGGDGRCGGFRVADGEAYHSSLVYQGIY